jgi:hypothetical protein
VEATKTADWPNLFSRLVCDMRSDFSSSNPAPEFSNVHKKS